MRCSLGEESGCCVCVIGPSGEPGQERTKEQTLLGLCWRPGVPSFCGPRDTAPCSSVPPGWLLKTTVHFWKFNMPRIVFHSLRWFKNDIFIFFLRLFKIVQQNQPSVVEELWKWNQKVQAMIVLHFFKLMISWLLYFQDRLEALYSRKRRHNKTENHSESDIVTQ